MDIECIKMEGLGNDFVIIEDLDDQVAGARPYPDLAIELCDRHFGIGADGLILILPSDDHDFKFRIFNSDGSSAQMCGNGMRCVAKFAYENKIIQTTSMRADTLAGTVIPEVILDENGRVQGVRVDMGAPVLHCPDIPFICDKSPAKDEPLAVGDETYPVTTVSMGNPHAVIFVDDLDQIHLKTIGPVIETHDRFPEKTNVEFIEVVSRDELKMKVWERGAGITLACGTGACASLVAAHLTDRTDREARIHLDSGDLTITWDEESGHVFKQGPAREVFRTQIQI